MLRPNARAVRPPVDIVVVAVLHLTADLDCELVDVEVLGPLFDQLDQLVSRFDILSAVLVFHVYLVKFQLDHLDNVREEVALVD